jgi:hypothetical protein
VARGSDVNRDGTSMTAQLRHDEPVVTATQASFMISQRGSAALWRLDPEPETAAAIGSATCETHSWTCIWCSMEPPICGSCRPVTPPCPANGRIHTCACREKEHTREAA